MKLIPEQIKYLRDRKRELELKRREYSDYLNTRDRTRIEGIGIPQFGSFSSDMEYYSYFEELKEIEEKLSRAEFIHDRNFDMIDIGTQFQLRFLDDDMEEELILVESGISHNTMKLVSIESDLGKAVYAHKQGDSIKYTVQATGRTIPITIEGICSLREKYEHFIKEKKLTDRISDKASRELRELKQNDAESYKKRHSITSSQLELAKEELGKISLASKNQSDISKRVYLSKLINSSIVEQPPLDDTIGIGSIVEVLLEDEFGNVEEKRFELINSAVSTEIESQYVERISPLGTAIYGLKANDTFKVQRKNKPKLKGIVKSVINMNELERVK